MSSSHTDRVPREQMVSLYREALECATCNGCGSVWTPAARQCPECAWLRSNILELQCKDRSHLVTMDIYTKPGERIVFSNPLNGMSEDVKAAKRLEIDREYTIRQIETHDSTTNVWLVEVLGVFNSVQFRNVRPA